MAFRFHLTQDDLRRISLARRTDPLLETVLSFRLLQQRHAGPLFTDWQTWALARLPRSAGLLRSLVPREDFCPDFLSPLGTTDVEEGLDTVLHTTKARLRADFDALATLGSPAWRPLAPAWLRAVADGEPRALQALVATVRDWYQVLVEPLREHMETTTGSARLTAGELLAEGLDSLLSGLHHSIRWRPPVLELRCSGYDWDIRMDGRGLRLIPSYFCQGEALIYLDPALPPAVIYPIDHESVWTPATERRREGSGHSRQTRLAALLGTTRAMVLRAIADEGGSAAGDLAQTTGISSATLSHHTKVLRQAGLITTSRSGGSVRHAVTPLGRHLLGGP
ncbi:ArsR/SmtB family transcription factor [Streptomyces sp. CA-249302]|uniref:ArsR/SmtB family transcription factor n=1 Tax=Streptomyces sp. CA-249302 TaxID=3240058 RepID=UPI003D8E2429